MVMCCANLCGGDCIVLPWVRCQTKVLFVFLAHLPLWDLVTFGEFREKNTETHVALRWYFSGPVSSTDSVKVSKYAASLVACTRKKFLVGGCGFFVSDVISRELLGHLGPLYLALGANR